MKYILILLICNGLLIADVIMGQGNKHPSVSLDHYKHLEGKHITSDNLVIQENHFYNNDCEEYIRKINEKEQEILLLKQEIKRLKSHADEKLQKKIKDEYEAKLKKSEFE